MADFDVQAIIQGGAKGVNYSGDPSWTGHGNLLIPVYSPSDILLDMSFEFSVNAQCFFKMAGYSPFEAPLIDRGANIFTLRLFDASDGSQLVCCPVTASGVFSTVRFSNTDPARGIFGMSGNMTAPIINDAGMYNFGTCVLSAKFYNARPGAYYYIQVELQYNPAQGSSSFEIYWNPHIRAEVIPIDSPQTLIQSFAMKSVTPFHEGFFPEIPIGENYEVYDDIRDDFAILP